MSGRTKLDRLSELVNIDVDSVDPRVAKALPFKAFNQTSNQAVFYTALCDEYNKEDYEWAVKEFGKEGWAECCKLCANNLPNVQNRVLIRLSPRNLKNKDTVLAQCHNFDKIFSELGVSRDQYGIKIPVVGIGMAAAKELNEQGIRTLGTSLFGLPQAIAASQAGCFAISPYYNEVRAYSDKSLWPDVQDPAINHPMSARLIHILETYTKLYEQTGKEQPIIIMASHANLEELFATASLGVQHSTILGHHLTELAATPDDLPPHGYIKPSHPYKNRVTPTRFTLHSTSDPLAGPDWDGTLARTDIDYLANGGEELDKAIKSDPVVTGKIKDVLDIFHGEEEKAREKIEKDIKVLFG
ncbi:hypothetical protein TREMEDRAFT_33000 [Tremella mesenterica DSM 1558]|uniref:uncharacterized protein n=1 Tax=Tremella mesenterica (strain ATCC 24925 / CBS 8224 / DSM 1558 / NBRC 9311 / NRRL Y-6157 / RJB 2259-6 / UBC 559-6) TaxID=578456 RepID=UPI0003F49E91|nr:uncharacterized protein TREMEDRAFT_33000 [Tremella mesenterica DSM 1558]EIW68111.1 hypothetical protein TREMEDRAFT_33000 [Tremella mesenterica DSM 1558]